jgi:hypothetical protein
MTAAPFKRCYCTAQRGFLAVALLLAFAFLGSTSVRAQITSNRARSKGPRAIAILEFDEKKRVHLVPVTIMLNGDFYDASAYKAAPVPMALDPGTVYEGVRTGVSDGLFTITLAHQVFGSWVGEGNWVATDIKPPEVKKPATKTPTEETEGPPVLRRPGAKQQTAAPAPAPAPTPKPSAPDDTDGIRVGGKVDDKKSTSNSAPSDPSDRPILRRGVPEKPKSEDFDTQPAKPWTVVTTIAAVSDAKSEASRSYHYSMRTEEETDLREKVQALAEKELQARVNSSTPGPTATRVSKTGKSKVASSSKFTDVHFRAFDPSTTNEPIFVYEANTPVLDKLSGKELPNHVMLVVRQDIYADMHVIFSSISDPTHMDSQPRCEFVDVVDAEGDGYGELLFRRTYDAGRAFSVYRVIGNQLWPLFEGKP